jgi:hypothetical protein
MDPMNSIWYYLEFQKQSSANRLSPFAKPETRPRKSLKAWIMQLLVPLFVVAAIVTFGVVCFLCPTFVS